MATKGEVDFMNHRHMSIDVVPAILPLVLVACPLAASEFRPVVVRTDAECYSNPPRRYAADKMIDGDLGSYACLPGRQPHGKGPDGLPAPRGAAGDRHLRFGPGIGAARPPGCVSWRATRGSMCWRRT